MLKPLLWVLASPLATLRTLKRTPRYLRSLPYRLTLDPQRTRLQAYDYQAALGLIAQLQGDLERLESSRVTYALALQDLQRKLVEPQSAPQISEVTPEVPQVTPEAPREPTWEDWATGSPEVKARLLEVYSEARKSDPDLPGPWDLAHYVPLFAQGIRDGLGKTAILRSHGFTRKSGAKKSAAKGSKIYQAALE